MKRSSSPPPPLASHPSSSASTWTPATIREKISQLNLEIGEIACYVSHDSVTSVRFPCMSLALSSGLRLDNEVLFFEPFDSKRLESTATRLARTRSVILLLTKKAFHSPYVVAEIAKAIELDIPIVPISIERGSLESAKTFLTSPDFPTKLEKENPRATKALEGIGIDLKHAHASLSEKVSTFLVKDLDLDCDLPAWHAVWNDIFAEIARVIKLKSFAGGEVRERVMRIGLSATFSDPEVRLALDNYKFLTSPNLGRGDDTLNALKRDVHLKRVPIDSLIRMTESAIMDPVKLSTCLGLTAVFFDVHHDSSISRTSLAHVMRVAKEALVAFGEKNVDVAQAGCDVAKNALHHRIVDDDLRARSLQSGFAEAVIRAMKAFGVKDPAVAKSGFHAVDSMIGADDLGTTTTKRDHLTAMMELGALEAIVMSMEAFAHVDAGVAAAGCHTISTLSRADGHLATTLMTLGAGRAVVAAMKAFSAEYLAVNEAGALAIVCLGARSFDVRDELMDLDAGSAVVPALMRAGSRYLSAAIAGCEAIACLSEASREIAIELMKLGAAKAVVAAMKSWGTKAESVAGHGSSIITGLAFYGNSDELLKMGAGEVVIAGMRAFGNEVVGVAYNGCSAVAHLIGDDGEHRATLKKMRADKEVLTAMRAFGTKEQVVAESGCFAIGRLVSVDDDAVELMNTWDELVVAAMRTFGEKEMMVAANGCYALSKLSRVTTMRTPLMKLGAGELVVRAMKVFGETEPNVAQPGCETIRELALGSVENQVALMKMGAGEVVVSAMRTLGAEDEEMADNACGAISALCRNSRDNALELMRIGVGEAILGSVRWHIRAASIVRERRICAMDDLIGNSDDNARALLRLDAAKVVLFAMKTSGRRFDSLAERGLTVIAKLAVDSDCVKVLSGLYAGKAVVDMVGVLGGRTLSVASSGCWAISRLAVEEDTATRLLEYGAGVVVVKALGKFGHAYEDVAEYGCLAIARLNRGRGIMILKSLGVIVVVLRALRCCGTWCSEVADRACEAIVSLMTTSSSDLRSFWVLDVGKATMDAMRVFGEIDVGVAENGCGVLVRLASVEEEWRREMRSWGGVEELLERIRVGHVGNERVVRGVEELKRLLG